MDSYRFVLLWAKPEERAGDNAVVCRTCKGQRTSQVQQRRVSSRSNVLVVQVRRTAVQDGDVLRHRVLAEEEVSLPDVGTFELAGWCATVVGASGMDDTRA